MPVNAELQAFLLQRKVDQAIVDYLGRADVGCLSIRAFANWVDSRSDIEPKILAKIPSHKDNQSQLALLKQAWREADALVTRQIARQSQGLAPEDLDEPLDPDVQKSYVSIFTAYHKWGEIDSRRIGSDSMFGRFRREFEARQPSMFPVLRVRSLATAQKAPPVKKQKLADGVSLVSSSGNEDMEPSPAQGIHGYLMLLDVLVFTWAVAGCFDVPYDGGAVKYASWPLLSQYAFQLGQRAWRLCSQYTAESVLEYIQAVEEDFRAKAIECARGGSQKPWGHALDYVIREHSSIWKDHDHVLQRSARHAAPAKTSSNADAAASDPTPSRPKWQTANSTAGGFKICKRNNDRRGCEQKCPRGEVHCCDIVLLSGKVCEKKDHTRQSHDPSKHGMPAVR